MEMWFSVALEIFKENGHGTYESGCSDGWKCEAYMYSSIHVQAACGERGSLDKSMEG